MKKQDRQVINKEQINRFFQSYYSEWRHIQVLAIQKKLKNKYTFYADIIEVIKGTDISAGDGKIAQEISNGLMFEAIQHCLQYIEDLFALINASENQDFFIKNIISYKAGSIVNKIRSPKSNREAICKQFFFPYQKMNVVEDAQTLNVFYDSVDRLIKMVKEISEFYKKYEFFYNQFKHGLSIALRPFNDFNNEQIQNDRKGKFDERPIVAIDSLNFKAASKNQYGNTGVILIPHITQSLEPHVEELQKENNLIRFLFSPPGLDIDNVLLITQMTKKSMQIFIHNFLQEVNGKYPMNLRLPAPDRNEVYEFILEL